MVTEKRNTKPITKSGKPGLKKVASSKRTSDKKPSSTKTASSVKAKSVIGKASTRKSTAASGGMPKPGTERAISLKRLWSYKKSGLNIPFIMLLLTVFLLGGASIYWLFSSKMPTNNEEETSIQYLAEASGQKPVGLPKVQPIKPNTQPAQSLSEESKAVSEQEPRQKQEPMSSLGQNLSMFADAGINNTFQLKEMDKPNPAEMYETTFGGPTEHSTKLIDSYILNILYAKGYSGQKIEILNVEQRTRPNDSYYFQKLSIEFLKNSVYFKNPARFRQDISRGLRDLQIGVELARQSENHYILSVNGLVTHEIFLHFSKPILEKSDKITVLGKEPMLVIMIDDVGESIHTAQTLVDLDYPVTLAIWPKATNARKCGEMGHRKGLEIMIHQPMEPMEYPRVKPGPGALFLSMSPAQITAQVRENIGLVPYAVGINNHMGSRFTQNRKGLEAVLVAVKEENLFVVDSLTHGGSIFYDLARENGFASQRRDIFLDVTRDKNVILHQLRKSERLAQSNGYAIAIGHPLPETLQALKEWEKTRNKNIKIVRVQDLLKYQR